MPGKLNADARCLACSEPVSMCFHTWKPAEGKVDFEYVHENTAIPDHTITIPIETGERLCREGRA